MSWLVENNPDEVSPLDDLRAHGSGMRCWCNPFMDGDVIVHNALDGREKYERGERKPS